jgi:hypothetical protein
MLAFTFHAIRRLDRWRFRTFFNLFVELASPFIVERTFVFVWVLFAHFFCFVCIFTFVSARSVCVCVCVFVCVLVFVCVCVLNCFLGALTDWLLLPEYLLSCAWHSQTVSIKYILSLSLSHTLFLSHTHTLSLSHTHTFSFFLSFSCSERVCLDPWLCVRRKAMHSYINRHRRVGAQAMSKLKSEFFISRVSSFNGSSQVSFAQV